MLPHFLVDGGASRPSSSAEAEGVPSAPPTVVSFLEQFEDEFFPFLRMEGRTRSDISMQARKQAWQRNAIHRPHLAGLV